MTQQQFYKEIETILDLSAGSITRNDILTDFEQWDSLAVLTFIAMADTHFKTLVSANDLTKCSTVADLMNLFPCKIS